MISFLEIKNNKERSLKLRTYNPLQKKHHSHNQNGFLRKKKLRAFVIFLWGNDTKTRSVILTLYWLLAIGFITLISAISAKFMKLELFYFHVPFVMALKQMAVVDVFFFLKLAHYCTIWCLEQGTTNPNRPVICCTNESYTSRIHEIVVYLCIYYCVFSGIFKS